MKVSERIKELRDVLANCTINTDGRCAIEYKISQLEAVIVQLEVEIVEALQIARQEGREASFDSGYTIGYRKGAYDEKYNAKTKV
ncbi:hypothetical protein LCGC14_2282890 [marine sediment metagenome]|uniref:Uncharacterized protein n=1 Tax=marine sediment metagenome TaxID=412755 RepID=A0A0F9F616_9ZZZZ